MLWQPEERLDAYLLCPAHPHIPSAGSNPEPWLLMPGHGGLTFSYHLYFLHGHCLPHQQVASGGSLHLLKAAALTHDLPTPH